MQYKFDKGSYIIIIEEQNQQIEKYVNKIKQSHNYQHTQIIQLHQKDKEHKEQDKHKDKDKELDKELDKEIELDKEEKIKEEKEEKEKEDKDKEKEKEEKIKEKEEKIKDLVVTTLMTPKKVNINQKQNNI